MPTIPQTEDPHSLTQKDLRRSLAVIRSVSSPEPKHQKAATYLQAITRDHQTRTRLAREQAATSAFRKKAAVTAIVAALAAYLQRIYAKRHVFKARNVDAEKGALDRMSRIDRNIMRSALAMRKLMRRIGLLGTPEAPPVVAN